MRVEAIQAALRPRAPYEAVDHGVHLLRHASGEVGRAWLALVVPLQVAALIVGSLLLGPDWALALVWWLKPLYDRVVLAVLSRALFGERPGVRAVARILWAQPKTAWLEDLTLRRASLSRALLLPVSQLEGLTGVAAVRRRRHLSARTSGPAHATLFVCASLEMVAVTGLAVGTGLLLPEALQEAFVEWITASLEGDQEGTIAMAVAYGLALTIAEPLYVATGFGLYLNRRTQIEGWDVELSFRGLARRLAEGVMRTLLLCVALGGGRALAQAPAASSSMPSDVGAEAQDEPPALEVSSRTRVRGEAALAEVAAREDLVVRRRVSRWEPKVPAEDARDDAELPEWLADVLRGISEVVSSLGPVGRALGVLFEWLIWAGLLILGALLVRAALRAHRARDGLRTHLPVARPAEIQHLPPEARAMPLARVAQAAREAGARGELARALGLLYGGAVRTFVERDGVSLSGAATEQECLSGVRSAALPPAVTRAFADLTHQWVRCAYGHRAPTEDRLRDLCDAYERTIEGRS